jgi:ATP-dependent Clp protease ATP-binding subunit ClpX
MATRTTGRPRHSPGLIQTRTRPEQAIPGFVAPQKFMRALDGLVGQEELKVKLSSVFSQYTLYLNDESAGRPLVLVAGRSGTGKTYAVERLIETAGLPYSIVSSASISPPSYRGKTMLDVFIQHWLDWEVDHGVIFLDEVDKWCHMAIGRDTESISLGTRSQAEMLKYVEKDTITFVDEAKDIDSLTGVKFRTKNILFICAGAFAGIETLIKRRLRNNFLPDDEIMEHAIPADYKRYGMLGELCDRIETYAWTNPLKQIQIVEILAQQEKPRWERRFREIDCELDLQDGALGRCAQHAFEQKEAARVAKAMLRRAMDDIFVFASMNGMKRVSVNANDVQSGKVNLDANL